jgi:S1-C subfamily serine protease
VAVDQENNVMGGEKMETAQTETNEPQNSEEEIQLLEEMATAPTQIDSPSIPPEDFAPPPPPPEAHPHKSHRLRKHALPAILVIVVLLASVLSVAAIYSIANLNQQVTALQNQVSTLKSIATTTGTVATSYTDTTTTTSLSALYASVKNSVVTIECNITESYLTPWGRTQATTSTSQGSGFVTQYSGLYVIITNNHVIADASTITVTFNDGNTYTATVKGTDTSHDVAVLTTDAPTSEYYPLTIASSSSVSVGTAVAAIGSPYGLSGTMTTGIISALDRTITVSEDNGSTYEMTGLLQTSAPINSGNSGGPLMTYDGKVIGITTAVVSSSDGLGFAVSSDTIVQVLQSIVE